jgi:hypothetical protein
LVEGTVIFHLTLKFPSTIMLLLLLRNLALNLAFLHRQTKIRAPAAASRGAQTSRVIPRPTSFLSPLLLGQDAAGLKSLDVEGPLVEGLGGNTVVGTNVFPGADADPLVI